MLISVAENSSPLRAQRRNSGKGSSNASSLVLALRELQTGILTETQTFFLYAQHEGVFFGRCSGQLNGKTFGLLLPF